MAHRPAVRFLSAAVTAILGVALFVSIGSSPAAGATSAPPSISDLRVDGAIAPVGLTDPSPRVSWVIHDADRGERQTAYQLKVSVGGFTVADSSKVTSSQALDVPLPTLPLVSRTLYTWSVRTYDMQGNVSAYASSTFETGLMGNSAWTNGRWVDGVMGNLYRKSFTLNAAKTVARALVSASAQGLYDLRLNGAGVTSAIEPAQTDWAKRVMVRTYDVTSALAGSSGEKVLGVALSNGWYRDALLAANPVPTTFKSPRFIVQLYVRYTDGSVDTVGSDGTWSTAAGPLRYEMPLTGEQYDATKTRAGWDRANYPADGWTAVGTAAVHTATEIGTVLEGDVTPPVRPVATRTAIRTTPLSGNRIVYDFGNIYSGWAKLRLSGDTKGGQVQVLYGQKLNADGTVFMANSAFYPGVSQLDRYTMAGTGTPSVPEIWEPRFTVKSYRYVMVTSPSGVTVGSLDGIEVHNDLATVGAFSTSDPNLNRIHEAAVRTELNTLQGLPVDNVVREKRGWGADAMLASELSLLNFDSTTFYRKYIADTLTSRDAGQFAMVSPDRWYGSADEPVWGSAMPVIAWRLYQYTGDRRVLIDNYDAIADHVDYLRTFANSDNTLTAPGFTYGDHIAVTPTNSGVQNTLYYYLSARIAAEAARMAGRSADELTYRSLATAIASGYRNSGSFYNAASRTFAAPTTEQFYGPSSHRDTDPAAEGVSALPLSFGIESLGTPLDLTDAGSASSDYAAAINQLTQRVHARGDHVETGLIATPELFKTFVKYNLADLAYDMLITTDHPSYLNMFSHGSTNIWEGWSDEPGTNDWGNSIDQPGLSAGPEAWFWSGLGGIRPSASGYGGFETFDLHPTVPSDVTATGSALTATSASTMTPRGTVLSAWSRSGSGLSYTITVPVGSTANVYLPRIGGQSVTVTEGTVGRIYSAGFEAKTDAGLTYVGTTPDAVRYLAGSGTYTFVISPAGQARDVSDVAMGRTVTARSQVAGGYSQWAPAELTNGLVLGSGNGADLWHEGYHSNETNTNPNQPEWASIDLGGMFSLSSVTLFPAHPKGYRAGFGFPLRFRIETSTDGIAWTTFADRTASDFPNPGEAPQTFAGNAVGRFVRIYATKLATIYGPNAAMALAEAQVFGAPLVTAALPVDDTSPAITYSGTWGHTIQLADPTAYVAGTVSNSYAAGSTATYSCSSCTGLAWMSPRNYDHGKAEVWIDNVLKCTCDLNSASFQPTSVIYQSPPLPRASHTIVVKALGTAQTPWVEVDAFLVTP